MVSSSPCVHAVHCIILYFVKGDNMVIKVQNYLDVLIIDETAVVFYLEFFWQLLWKYLFSEAHLGKYGLIFQRNLHPPSQWMRRLWAQKLCRNRSSDQANKVGLGIQVNKTDWSLEKVLIVKNGRAVKEIVNLIGCIDKKCRENYY